MRTDTISNEETTLSRFYSNSEAFASELLLTLAEMYYMYSDVFGRFISSTTR